MFLIRTASAAKSLDFWFPLKKNVSTVQEWSELFRVSNVFIVK